MWVGEFDWDDLEFVKDVGKVRVGAVWREGVQRGFIL